MGQPNSKRSQYKAIEKITSTLSAARQEMDFTGYFEVGDIVDIVSRNPSGALVSTLATGLTVSAIQKDVALILSAAIDTSTALPAGADSWYIGCRQIDDSHEAIDRLYRKKGNVDAPGQIQVSVNSVGDSLLDVDIDGAAQIGNSVLLVDQVSLLRVGDTVQVLADSGLLGTATIVALDPMADNVNNYSRIELDQVVDTSGETNVVVVAGALSLTNITSRLAENIDKIDQPVENEDISEGNNIDTVFETDNLFLLRTSKVLIDGVRKRLGTAGTKASLTLGTFPANNDAIRADAMILGLLGNRIEFRIVNAAGTAITVEKQFKVSGSNNFSQSFYRISINNASGTATAKQLCDLLNAHAEVRRIAQFRYGGTGLGLPAAVAYTAFSGGLNNGTGDYAEIEQVFQNQITQTGYKFISFRIDNVDINSMNMPPETDEYIVGDYRRALMNA